MNMELTDGEARQRMEELCRELWSKSELRARAVVDCSPDSLIGSLDHCIAQLTTKLSDLAIEYPGVH